MVHPRIVFLTSVACALGPFVACGSLAPDDSSHADAGTTPMDASASDAESADGSDGGNAAALDAASDSGTGLADSGGAPSEGGILSDAGNADAGAVLRDASVLDSSAPFALSTTAIQVNVVRGSSAQVPVALVASAGFAGAVKVSVSNLPPGVTARALTFSPGETSALLTLDAASSATLGVGNLTIVGEEGALLSTAIALPILVQDASGTLDTTFGTGGVTTLMIPGATSCGISGRGIAIQPDGKIAFSGDVNYNDVLVGRFNADGTLDTSFSTNGFFTSNALAYGTEVAFAVRALPQGGLVTAGFGVSGTPSSELWSMVVTKFLDDGTLDPSFGAGGGYTAIQAGDTNAEALDLVVQPDGKLVAGGFQPYGTSALVRLTPSGANDPTFDPSGTAAINVNTYPEAGAQINALALLPDGDILATTQDTNFLGFRFTSQGVLDPSYGTNGQASAAAPAAGLSGWDAPAIVVQPGGTPVYVGSTSSTIELARFTEVGQLDPSFGAGGRVSTTVPGSATVNVSSAAMMPDGRIVVAAALSTATPIGVARYTTSGALDSSFAGVGYTGFSGNAAGGTEAVAVDAVGRIVVIAGLDGAVNIARFWP